MNQTSEETANVLDGYMRIDAEERAHAEIVKGLHANSFLISHYSSVIIILTHGGKNCTKSNRHSRLTRVIPRRRTLSRAASGSSSAAAVVEAADVSEAGIV